VDEPQAGAAIDPSSELIDLNPQKITGRMWSIG
jgi:hypothetical protein